MKLSELKALAENATPGPWYADPIYGLHELLVLKNKDFTYIAAANPQTILKLIERIEGLGDALRELSIQREWQVHRIAKIALAKFGPDAELA